MAVPDQLLTGEEKVLQQALQDRQTRAVKLLEELGLVKDRRVQGEHLKRVIVFAADCGRRGASAEREKLAANMRCLASTIDGHRPTDETSEQAAIREGMAAFARQIAEEIERMPIDLKEVRG